MQTGGSRPFQVCIVHLPVRPPQHRVHCNALNAHLKKSSTGTDRVHGHISCVTTSQVHKSSFSSSYDQQFVSTMRDCQLPCCHRMQASVARRDAVLTGLDALKGGADTSLQHCHDCAKEANVEKWLSCSNTSSRPTWTSASIQQACNMSALTISQTGLLLHCPQQNISSNRELAPSSRWTEYAYFISSCENGIECHTICKSRSAVRG